MGNAERLVATYGAQIRYCPERNEWLAWDGQRWKRDQVCEVERLAKLVVRGIYREASRVEDQARREELGKWALKSETSTAIRSMVFLARSDPRIRVSPEMLDAAP